MSSLETVELRVPAGKGYLIGNTLRQFAMRGCKSWQPAGYRIACKEGSFGFAGGYPFNSMAFFSGKLISPNEPTTVTEKLCKFELVNGEYVCDNMIITGLSMLGVPSMDVCLVYAAGSRTQQQNLAVVKSLCPKDMKDFAIVPSKHTGTIKFSYSVSPCDTVNEILTIDATEGSVQLARDSAVQSLQGLHI